MVEFNILVKNFDDLVLLLKDNNIPLNIRKDIGVKIQEKKPQETLNFFMDQAKKQLAVIKPRVTLRDSFWEELGYSLEQIRTICEDILNTPKKYNTFKTKILKKNPRRTRLQRML